MHTTRRYCNEDLVNAYTMPMASSDDLAMQLSRNDGVTHIRDEGDWSLVETDSGARVWVKSDTLSWTI